MKQFDGQVPQELKDQAKVKDDALVQLLRSKRPAEIDAYIDAHSTTWSKAEKQMFKVIAKLAIYR